MSCARSGWTDTPDGVASCSPDTVHVEDGEEIARLLHDKNSDSPKEKLKREELFAPKKDAVRNRCRDPLGSHGASLVRSRGLSDSDLRRLSKDYAEKKPAREPRGAVAGTAAALRAVKSKLKPDQQMVFVYDDPTKDDVRHCVVRIADAGRPEGDYLRGELLKALSRIVTQSPA